MVVPVYCSFLQGAISVGPLVAGLSWVHPALTNLDNCSYPEYVAAWESVLPCNENGMGPLGTPFSEVIVCMVS